MQLGKHRDAYGPALIYDARIDDALLFLSNLLALDFLENFITYSFMMLDEYNA